MWPFGQKEQPQQPSSNDPSPPARITLANLRKPATVPSRYAPEVKQCMDVVDKEGEAFFSYLNVQLEDIKNRLELITNSNLENIEKVALENKRKIANYFIEKDRYVLVFDFNGCKDNINMIPVLNINPLTREKIVEPIELVYIDNNIRKLKSLDAILYELNPYNDPTPLSGGRRRHRVKTRRQRKHRQTRRKN